jgi:undecaprenyl pyrophosphate phosphatase UppP
MGATRSAITVTRLLVATIQLRMSIRFAFFIKITLTLRRCLSGVNRPNAKAAQNEQFS